jgi:hypothetical protein
MLPTRGPDVKPWADGRLRKTEASADTERETTRQLGVGGRSSRSSIRSYPTCPSSTCAARARRSPASCSVAGHVEPRVERRCAPESGTVGEETARLRDIRGRRGTRRPRRTVVRLQVRVLGSRRTAPSPSRLGSSLVETEDRSDAGSPKCATPRRLLLFADLLLDPRNDGDVHRDGFKTVSSVQLEQ